MVLIVELFLSVSSLAALPPQVVSALEGRIADYGADKQDVMQTTADHEEN